MSKNRTHIFLGLAGGLLLLILIFLFTSNSVSWDENLAPKNKDPYGTFMIRQLLEGVRNEQGFVFIDDSLHKRLPIDPTPNKVDNYVFIGKTFYGDSLDRLAMMNFVEAGNNAFILMDAPHVFFDALSNKMNTTLSNAIELQEEVVHDDQFIDEPYYDGLEYELMDTNHTISQHWIRFYTDTLLRMSVWDKGGREWKYNMRKFDEYEAVEREWSFLSFSEAQRISNNISSVGTFDGYINNAIALPFGKGQFFFHTTPLVFTNFYVKQRDGMNYARGFMSHLGEGVVYWDDENVHYQWKKTKENKDGYQPDKPKEGPLEFILSQKNLKRAWYTLLMGTLLYVIFAAKRKQRAIRSISKPRNTSIEFAEVVSQLFLKQSDHTKLIKMKMDLWRAHAREKYRIVWPDADFLIQLEQAAELSAKSGLPYEVIKDIIESYNGLLMEGMVDTPAMLDLHNKFEFYYQNCK